MTRRKGKQVSFDAMVKFFMHQYGIPTKKDLEKVMERLDRLEKTIRDAVSAGRARNASAGKRPDNGASAAELVLEVIAKAGCPVSIADIKEKTGYGDKKLRNIIFRLHKTGDIAREHRGRYVVSAG